MFTDPLDNIRVASPCPTAWDEMYGDDRKRFCSECKLNVYNLSGMTRREAESLVRNHEGRLCVRFFKRADGTVLTADCPVGWAKIKQRVSRVATAAASIILGFAGGLLSVRATEGLRSLLTIEPVSAVSPKSVDFEVTTGIATVGEAIVGDADVEVLGQTVLPRVPRPSIRRPTRK